SNAKPTSKATMNIKIRLILIFHLAIINASFCQYTQENEKHIRFKMGMEMGIGFNEIDREVSLKKIPSNSPGIYSGWVFKYLPQKTNNIALNSGIRYQKKGDWSSSSAIHSHILLVPFELEIYIFKAKKINPFLKLGTALEVKLNQGDSDFFERNQFSNNFRVGIGGIYSINPKYELGLQIQRTMSRSSYRANRFSPGGSAYDTKYQNSGFEFGVFLIKRIPSKK
ncbi:MAG: hypothetical protein AAF985_20495, partial [Bacteroidota bacterium]